VLARLDTARKVLTRAIEMNDAMHDAFAHDVPTGMTEAEFSKDMAARFPTTSRENVAANAMHLISMALAECPFQDDVFVKICNDIVQFVKMPRTVMRRVAKRGE